MSTDMSLHQCYLEVPTRPTQDKARKKRERRGDASDRSYGSLVVQEEKPSCKDRVGKWDIAPRGAPETPARKGRLNARFQNSNRECVSNSQAFGGLPTSRVLTRCCSLKPTLRD